jgi:hypothetical protein
VWPLLYLSFPTPSYHPSNCLVVQNHFLTFLFIPILGRSGRPHSLGDGSDNPFHSIGGNFARRAHAAHSIRSRDRTLPRRSRSR